jgi:hypothetical protein
MKLRIAFLLASIVVGETAAGLARQTADPVIRTELTLDAVNGTNHAQRGYEYSRGQLPMLRFAGYAVIGALLFWPRRRSAETQPTKNP